MTIKLKPNLMHLVKGGFKKATTRFGVKDYTLGPETLVNSEDPEDKIEITVTGLELATKRYIASSQRICALENYEEPLELITVLESIYGKIEEDDEFTIVHFKVIAG